jgi:hypothetical protein
MEKYEMRVGQVWVLKNLNYTKPLWKRLEVLSEFYALRTQHDGITSILPPARQWWFGITPEQYELSEESMVIKILEKYEI